MVNEFREANSKYSLPSTYPKIIEVIFLVHYTKINFKQIKIIVLKEMTH